MYPDLALQFVIPLVGTSKRPKSVDDPDLSPLLASQFRGVHLFPLVDVRSVCIARVPFFAMWVMF